MRVDSVENKALLWKLLYEGGGFQGGDSPRRAKHKLDDMASQAAAQGLDLTAANKWVLRQMLAKAQDPSNPFVPDRGNPTFADPVESPPMSPSSAERAARSRATFEPPISDIRTNVPDTNSTEELDDLVSVLHAPRAPEIYNNELSNTLAAIRNGQDEIIRMLRRRPDITSIGGSDESWNRCPGRSTGDRPKTA